MLPRRAEGAGKGSSSTAGSAQRAPPRFLVLADAARPSAGASTTPRLIKELQSEVDEMNGELDGIIFDANSPEAKRRTAAAAGGGAESGAESGAKSGAKSATEGAAGIAAIADLAQGGAQVSATVGSVLAEHGVLTSARAGGVPGLNTALDAGGAYQNRLLSSIEASLGGMVQRRSTLLEQMRALVADVDAAIESHHATEQFAAAAASLRSSSLVPLSDAARLRGSLFETSGQGDASPPLPLRRGRARPSATAH